MKYTVLVLSLALAGCATVVKDSPDARRTLATQVVNELGPDRLVASMRDQIHQFVGRNLLPGMSPEMKQRFEKQSAEAMAIMKKYVTPEKIRAAMIDAYAQTFTAAELAQLQTFYASDIGRALSARQADIAVKTLATLQPAMQQAMAEIRTTTMNRVLAAERTPIALAPPAAGTGNSEAVAKLAADLYPDAQARFRHAQQLAAEGKKAEALAEYLWCYDHGMRESSQYAGVRLSFLLRSLATLAHSYEPARQALYDRRDAAGARLHANAGDYAAQMDFAALNRELGDHAANLALFDQMPADARAREMFGRTVFDDLVAAKRYQDAVACRSYAQFHQLFATILASSRRQGFMGSAGSMFITRNGAAELEALAGAGDLDHARELLKQFREEDPSEATRRVLREHLERAGHPELIEDSKAPDASKT